MWELQERYSPTTSTHSVSVAIGTGCALRSFRNNLSRFAQHAHFSYHNIRTILRNPSQPLEKILNIIIF